MTLLQRVLAGVISLVVMALIIDLVKRRKLREEYSILWLASGFVMVLVAAHGEIVTWLAYLMGVKHAAYSLFVIAMTVGLVLAVHFTVILSKLTTQNWRLTQEVGLLKTELSSIKQMQQDQRKTG